MSILVKKVTTGDVIVFDKAERVLFLIDASHSESILSATENQIETAKELVSTGKGKQFDRNSLEKLQAALAGIVMLG